MYLFILMVIRLDFELFGCVISDDDVWQTSHDVDVQ